MAGQDLVDGRYMYIVQGNTWKYSTDYGVNWTPVETDYYCNSSSKVTVTWDGTGSICYKTENDATGSVFMHYVESNGNVGAVTVPEPEIKGEFSSYVMSTETKVRFSTVNAGTGWTTGYSTTVFVGTEENPSVSKKVFSTWDQAGGVSACSKDGQYAVIGVKAGYTNGFYTVDGGETWAETLATSSYGYGNGTQAIDMSNSGQYTLVGSPNGLFRDSGYLAAGYETVKSGNVTAVAVSGEGRVQYHAIESQLFISNDCGETWENLNSPVNVTISKLRVNRKGDIVVMLTETGEMYCSHNYGISWTQVAVGVDDVAINK